MPAPALRPCLAAAVLAAFLAGCAAPGPREPVHAEVEGAALDLAGKFKVPNREKGKLDKARVSAQYQLALEADENGPPSAAQIFAAHEQRHAIEKSTRAKAAGLQASQWQALGPSNVGGRVRAIAFDPRNANRVLAGAASGGIWISEDLAASWRPNNDFLPNLSVTSFAFDAGDPSVVYAGTGEESAGLVGVGAFKSVDSGLTWSFLAATSVDANADWRFVNRVAAHPSQAGLVLAGVTNSNRTSGGIYRSTDGGATWAKVSAAMARDLAFDPNTPANVLAGLDDGTFAYSRDAGLTWSRTAQLVTPPATQNGARAEIAFARTQPGLVYASIDMEKGQVWKSTDSGVTWTKTATPEHLGSQGWYDNAIWVDPTDANHVMVAGLDIYRSRDGGATFLQVSDWRIAPNSPHADHHALVSPPDYGPGRRVLLNGNDGGIYRAADALAVDTGGGWTNVNNGLAVTQFYSGAGKAAAGGRIVGGTQDNGSLQLSQGTWRTVRGGDGGFTAVDPRGDQTVYGEYVYLSIHRSQNAGLSASYICEGITEGMPSESGNTYCGSGATKKANFIAPFILDPNNPNRLLGGAASLWVSDNATAAQPSWRTIKPPSAATDNFISAIDVRAGDANAIWVGHNNGEVYRSTDGNSASPSWTRVGAGVLPARTVQRIMTDPDNPARAIVAVTGFVANNLWQTLDGGATWTSITGNLPAAPIFDVKRNPVRGDWLYVATSVGMFTSENGGRTWSTTNEGPANIRVRELFWIDNTTLGAATYGRGMWKINVASAGASSYDGLWWGGEAENGWGLSIAQHASKIFAAIYAYDAQGQPTWYALPDGTWDPAFTTYTGPIYSSTGSYWGNYDTGRFVLGAPVGQATLRFTDPDNGVLTYTVNGVSGSKPIRRNVFGPVDATPTGAYGDLWWGGDAQGGWGVTLAQQYRTLFLAWYTYDAQGKPTWFVMSGGTWTSANTYTGRAYRTSSSAWLGVPYNASSFRVTDVGSITLTFTDPSHATFTYTIDGVTQSKPLARFPF